MDHVQIEGDGRHGFVDGIGAREGSVTVVPEGGTVPEHESDGAAKEKGLRISTGPGGPAHRYGLKKRTESKLPRITVAAEGTGQVAGAPHGASDALPIAIPKASADGQLVLPSKAELELILARAETCEDLAAFERMAAACADLARHCDHLKDRLAEFNILRLRSRRGLGLVLLQTDRRGGDRAKWLGATLPVDPSTAKKCRKLARIPESAIDEYFRLALAQDEVPSEAGVIRLAAKLAKANSNVPAKPKKPKQRKAEPTGLVLSPAILACVERVLGQIDVCVGDAKVKCKRTLKPDAFQPTDLRGTVFVAECLYPAEWLLKLAKLRRSTGINDVLVALPAETSAAWFKDLMESEDQWVCCFPTGVQPPIMLAHLGHHEGLKAACAEMGAIVRQY